MVSVRYIVDDVDAAIDFYAGLLGFGVQARPAPGFAIVRRGELRLLLSAPGAGGAGQPMPDGREPAPGGWNRIQLEVEDLEATIAELRMAGARLRNAIVTGFGGSQIRSCWRTRPAIRSSCSSRDGIRPTAPPERSAQASAMVTRSPTPTQPGSRTWA